ncbi:hypothetical protein JKA74_19690 [Marivirga sp. S37H4]|uniref:Peptidase M43 pregnancy-associated plasma-A domain-containing protein n=1 Tax=Marivirga aurantiaca TaxID=2802615 RepID=A0A934X233_9BACT|nr:M43 family zinc metalloprotease [Marivirga aurantiaca]MBK6267274.1 hypothetical protein [Marivirga aurantiaca]
MKALLILLILASNGYFLLSQNINTANISDCGTPFNLENYNRQKVNSSNSRLLVNPDSKLGVNVKVHFVRKNDGSGAKYNHSILNNLEIGLSNKFKDYNILFDIIGYTNINNTTYFDYDIVVDPNVSLFNINNDPNVINIYILNRAQVFTGLINGRAKDIPSNAFLITYDALFTTTMQHEMGHCLNLYHTFQGTATNTSGCAELVPSVLPNCEECGDLVCDTPADANTGRTGMYNPDIQNFMSYYRETRNRFTNGQKNRMLQTFYDENVVARTMNLHGNLYSSKKLACRGDGVTVSYNLNELPAGVTFSNWELSINAAPIWRNNTSVTFYLPSNSPYPSDMIYVTGYFRDRFNNVIKAKISVEFLSRNTPTPFHVATYSSSPNSGYQTLNNTTFCTNIDNGQYIYIRFNKRLKNISMNKTVGDAFINAGDRTIDGYDYMIYIPSANQYNFFQLTGTDICTGDLKNSNECIWLPRSRYVLGYIKNDEVQVELDDISLNIDHLTSRTTPNSEVKIQAYNEYGKKLLLSEISFDLNHIKFNTSYSGLIILKIIGSDQSVQTLKILK